MGGSTNFIIHLTAIAGRIGVPLELADFDRLGSQIHLLVTRSLMAPMRQTTARLSYPTACPLFCDRQLPLTPPLLFLRAAYKKAAYYVRVHTAEKDVQFRLQAVKFENSDDIRA